MKVRVRNEEEGTYVGKKKETTQELGILNFENSQLFGTILREKSKMTGILVKPGRLYFMPNWAILAFHRGPCGPRSLSLNQPQVLPQYHQLLIPEFLLSIANLCHTVSTWLLLPLEQPLMLV